MNKKVLVMTSLIIVVGLCMNLQAQNKDLTFTANGVSFTMKYVEGGSFYMGSDDDIEDERPMHKVNLDDYYMAETEVTQALWEAVMGFSITQHRNNIDSDLPMLGTGRDYPAYYISWIDCQEFISRLNALTGKTFRLPTEAEWEYAARGGRKSKGYIYAGSNNLSDIAWISSNSGGQTHQVKKLKPNELELYDMNGNVSEWCNDWYGPYGVGGVKGLIVDEFNVPLPGATIVIKKGGQDIAYGNTDIDGFFFINLSDGTFDMEVRYIGYAGFILQGLKIRINECIQINNIVMQPYQEKDVIVVEYKPSIHEKSKKYIGKDSTNPQGVSGSFDNYDDEKVIRGLSMAPNVDWSDYHITARGSEDPEEHYLDLFGLFVDLYGFRLALSK